MPAISMMAAPATTTATMDKPSTLRMDRPKITTADKWVTTMMEWPTANTVTMMDTKVADTAVDTVAVDTLAAVTTINAYAGGGATCST